MKKRFLMRVTVITNLYLCLLILLSSQGQEMNQESTKPKPEVVQQELIETKNDSPKPSKTELSKPEPRLAKLEKPSSESRAKQIREWVAFSLSLLATAMAIFSLWSSKMESKRNRLNQAKQHLETAWDHLGSPETTPEILADSGPAARLNLKEAEKEIKQALELAPKLPLVYIRRGDFFRAQGNEDKAFKEYEKALELSPMLAKAFRKRGNVYRSKGNNEAALADFSKAIQLDQNDYLAYYNRGNIFKSQKKYSEAIADFDQCIQQNPSFAAAWVNRGIVYKAQGDLEQAIADYSEALKRNSRDDQVFFNRALAYKEKGKLYSAISDLKSAIDLRPDYRMAHYSRARILKQMGHLERAFAGFVQVMELGPVVPLEDHQTTLKQLDRALSKNPGDIGILFNRALALSREQKWEKAVCNLEDCIRVIAEGPSAVNDPQPLNFEHNGSQSRMETGEQDISFGSAYAPLRSE